MRARDVIGRQIVGVRQTRVATRETGDGRELQAAWAVWHLALDNGTVLILHAVETDTEPIVTAWVTRP